MKGTIYHPEGLNLEELTAAKDQIGNIDRGRLAPGPQLLGWDEWMNLDVDVLVPAAIGDAIREDNVRDIRARLVFEGANCPVSEQAEAHPGQNGAATIPDFIAHAGAAGGLGMLLTGQAPPDASRILEESAIRLKKTTREVLTVSRDRGIPSRRAAVELARSVCPMLRPYRRHSPKWNLTGASPEELWTGNPELHLQDPAQMPGKGDPDE